MEEQVIVGLSKEVLEKLDILAQKIGVTVEQIWPWLVKQQYVEAFYPALLFIIFAIGALPMCYFAKRVDWDEDNLTTEQIVVITLSLLGGMGFVASFIVTIHEFGNIFNPEYWALKDLMRMVIK